MDSIPPATMTSRCPRASVWAASVTAFSPYFSPRGGSVNHIDAGVKALLGPTDAQTLLIVVASVVTGHPARIVA